MALVTIPRLGASGKGHGWGEGFCAAAVTGKPGLRGRAAGVLYELPVTDGKFYGYLSLSSVGQ